MEILRADGTWAEQQHEQWESVSEPDTPQTAFKQASSNPEEVAELYSLSTKLGVSQKAIKDNIDVARKASSMPDFDKLQERAPVLVGQSRDSWFMSLAQDDLENLATVEERTAALKKQRQEQVNATATQSINALSSSIVPGFVKRTDTYKEFASGQSMDRGGVLWEKRRKLILQGKDLPASDLEYLAQLDAASSFETTKTGLPSFIPAAGELIGQMSEAVTAPKVLEKGLVGAITGAGLGAMASAPTAGLAAPVTATSGAVTGAGLGLKVGYFEHAHDVEAGQAFKEFRTLQDGDGNQLDDKTAAVAAELVGVVNATLETVGFSAVAKVVPGLRKVMASGVKGLILTNPTIRKAFFNFAKDYAMAWTGEVSTEVMQELTNIIVGGVLQDESITETITSPDTLAQLQDIAVKVGKGMAVTGLAGGGVTLASDVKAAHRAKTEATARKQKFVDFATSAEASRLKERSPEAFGEFMQRVGQKHGVETVLLQADRVVETLVEQQGMAPEEVSAWAQQYGVSQQELATAMQTGGTIELEFGKVAANLGKDETITLFQDDFHLEHGETTINAVADSVQGESQTAVRIKELYEEEQQRLITPDLADQIISDITAQLKDANIKGDNPALSVMPIIARANVLAKLTGTDAAEHLQRFGITIQRQGFDEFAAEHQLDAAQFQGAGKIDTQQAWSVPLEEFIKPRATEPLPHDVFYVSGVEIIQNPTSDDYRQFRKEVNEKFPGNKDATVRFTEDADGNRFIWKAHEAIHSQIEPVIAERLQRPVSQNPPQRDKAEHRRAVYQALKDEKPVPQEVLAGYRDDAVLGPMIAGKNKTATEATFSRMDEAGATTEKQRAEAKRLWQEKGTDSPYFKKWFGDSKVVDENGKPLVMYHGTDNKFDVFDTSDKSLDFEVAHALGENIGSFFAAKENDAKDFGRNVQGFYVSLKNPKVFKDQNEFRAFMRENSGRTPDIRDADGYIVQEGVFENNMRSALETAGHDGVVIKNPQYSAKKDKPWVVAFSPEQIKSATGNLGTFDGTNPDITFSRMDEAGATTDKQQAEAKRLWQEKGVESPYFKKWFGDSKVVDENGKPLVVYHGTPTGGFTEFADGHDAQRVQGVYFAKTPEDVRRYTKGDGASIYPVYLSLQNPATREVLNGLGYMLNGKEMKDELVRLGYDGVVDEFMGEIVAFSPEQIKSATGNQGTFDATDPRISYQADTIFRTDAAPRGALISGEGNNLITLFEQANVSTFLHEMGHLFLNDLEYVADKYGVQVDEWNAIKEWLGVDGEITTEQHEQFARGFEAYLREGEAPVAGLRAAFRQFKSWLVKIYRTADALQVDINDDLRRVFDRLVATEEEIQQARELAAQVAILDEKFFSEVGATDAEKEEYRASVNSAEYSATEKKDKQRVGKLDDRLKEFRAQAKEEIKQEPLYKAMDELVEKGGIDKASVTRLFGKINLPNVKGLFKKDGLDIEHAAIEAGYESAREFVEAMSKAKTKQQWIEQRVAQLEIEHDQGLTTEEAIRTAQSRKQMELESKWLARKEGQQRSALTRRALKVWADQTTAAQKLGDAIKITKLITASRKLRQQVIAATKKGDWTTAFNANEKARLNEALIASHYRANAEYTKAQARWKRAVKADVAYEYRQQINQLMLKHQMVSRRLDIDDGTKSLSEFLSDLNANLDDISALSVPVFGDWLGNDKGRAISEMTWGEVQELDDMLKFLVGRGREVKKGLLSDEKTAIADLAAEAVIETAKMKGKKISRYGSLSRKIQDVKESYFASTKLPLWIFRQMDGWAGVSKKSKDGVNVRELWGRLAKALDALYVAKEDMGKKIQPHLTQLITSWKKNGDEIKTTVPIPDCYKADNRQWTFENIVLMALNIGTVDNMQRLSSGFTIDGMPMSEDQILELTSILSVKDWAAIKGITESIDSLFPQVDSVHLKINHSRMKKVHARPIRVRANDGTEIEYSGGYFPIRYDGSLSFMAGMWDEKSDMLSRQAAVFQTPSAKSSFANQRTANGAGLPVKLSMSVLSEHLEDVLRFTYLAQAVRDVDRVTQHKTYRNEASRVLGNELYRLIRPSLKHIIRPEKSGGSRWDRTLDSAMKKSSAFYMAWNVVTAVKNFGGFFMALAEVNKVDLAIGYLAFFKNPKDSYDAVLKLSAYMRSRYTQYDKDFKRKMYKFAPEKEILGYSHEDLVSAGYFGIIAADSMVFLPSWLGTFKGELARNGGDIERAVSTADLKIRTLQPAGNELELSHMQRSTEGLASVGRLVTPFFGFAGNFGNVQRAYVAAFRAGKMPLHEFMTKMFWACVAQPVAPLVLLSYLRTGEPPEPEEIAKEIVGHNVQGFPVVRDVVGYSLGSGYGDAVSTPALEFINIVARLGEDSVDAGANMFAGEFSSEDAGKVIFGLSEIGSYATGVPVSQVYKRLKKGYDQVESGDGTAVNLIFPKRKGE